MSKKVKMVLYTLVVLLSTLIILLVVDMKNDSAIYSEETTEIYYVNNSVNLDEKVEAYLNTTEVNEQVSSNTIGSLKIEGVLEHPIMYNTDIAYYTQHDCYDNPSKEGAIFLDSRITEYDNRVLLIHGLTTEDGTMFSVLKNYLDSSWALQNKQLILNLQGIKTFELFSVIKLQEQESLIQLDCDSDSVYTNFYETLIAQSVMPCECTFDVEKQMVILNTVTLDGEYIMACFLEVK